MNKNVIGTQGPKGITASNIGITANSYTGTQWQADAIAIGHQGIQGVGYQAVSGYQGSFGITCSPGKPGYITKNIAFLIKELKQFEKKQNMKEYSNSYWSKYLLPGKYTYLEISRTNMTWGIFYKTDEKIVEIYDQNNYLVATIKRKMFTEYFTRDLQIYRNLMIDNLVS